METLQTDHACLIITLMYVNWVNIIINIVLLMIVYYMLERMPYVAIVLFLVVKQYKTENHLSVG